MQQDTDTTTPRFLRDKYAVVGVGETEYSRNSGRTTRHMAVEAIRSAMQDAGLGPGDVDGMMSYSLMDSTQSPTASADLGIRLNFYTDIIGGGSSIECLIGLAIGAIEAGMCHTVALFRSMNGATAMRMGGSGWGSGALSGDALFSSVYGQTSPAQMFSQTFMRHLYEYGTTPEQVAHVKVFHSWGASNNPKAYYNKRVTVDDVMQSRMIVKPLHLLDCCVETDNATCIIVTSAERARNLRQRPARILAALGRVSKPRGDDHHQHGPITRVAGHYAKELLWPNAGVGPEDVDITGSYDAFSFTTLLQLEDYGFCEKGEAGPFVESGAIALSGSIPVNTHGGFLSEGYVHGLNHVTEAVSQLRHDAGDRQVEGAEIALSTAQPGYISGATAALVLRRDA